MKFEYGTTKVSLVKKKLSEIKPGEIFINSIHDVSQILDGTSKKSFGLYMMLDPYTSQIINTNDSVFVNLKTHRLAFGKNIAKNHNSRFYVVDASMSIKFITSEFENSSEKSPEIRFDERIKFEDLFENYYEKDKNFGFIEYPLENRKILVQLGNELYTGISGIELDHRRYIIQFSESEPIRYGRDFLYIDDFDRWSYCN